MNVTILLDRRPAVNPELALDMVRSKSLNLGINHRLGLVKEADFQFRRPVILRLVRYWRERAEAAR